MKYVRLYAGWMAGSILGAFFGSAIGVVLVYISHPLAAPMVHGVVNMSYFVQVYSAAVIAAVCGGAAGVGIVLYCTAPQRQS